MEHTLALIEKAHEGDKAARDTLAEENMGLVWSVAPTQLSEHLEHGEAVCKPRGGDGGSVPDREHWAVEGD